MIFVTFSFVAGVLCLQQMSRLPGVAWGLLALLSAALLFRYPKCRLVGCFLSGWAWALLAANVALEDRLAPELEGKDLLIEGRVSGIPQPFDHGVRFGFEIDGVEGVPKESFPGKVRLSWYSPLSELRAGERWRFEVRLKQPHGTFNPGGFDYEQWLYLQGYRATGYLRPNPENRRLENRVTKFSVDSFRQSIAERLSLVLKESPVGGIVQALMVGEREGITEEQWEVFRNTGTAHLVAISGLHIGLVAGIAFLIGRGFWLRFGALRITAPGVGAFSAIACSTLYAGLAGFSLPTQRALIMIGLTMGAVLLRRPLVPSHTLALALFLIVLLEPTSVLSAGLWLSFSAVALILYTLAGRVGKIGYWSALGKIHIATAVGLAPLLLLYFQRVSLIAPLGNLLAVPVVSLLVVPAALLGTILMLILPGAGNLLLKATAFVLEILWGYLDWLSGLPFAHWTGSPPSLPILLLALAGLLLVFAPRGIKGRWLAIPMLSAVVFAPTAPPHPGELRFTLLDVGQGLAAVVETAQHTLVFDTGARFSEDFDMGSAVVAPFLRSRNIEDIDRLIVSHADNDHSGGARSLDHLLSIERIDTSVQQSIEWRRANECTAGQHWNWDGIEFQMLAPLPDRLANENDLSCVLKIISGSRTILLTGDIEKTTEMALVVRYGSELKSDYLIVAHHGSNTSSTSEFLNAVRPEYALIPAGYRNRYGFPRPEVVARLKLIGAQIYNTADSGALLIPPDAEGDPPAPLRYRETAGKYFHFGARINHETWMPLVPDLKTSLTINPLGKPIRN